MYLTLLRRAVSVFRRSDHSNDWSRPRTEGTRLTPRGAHQACSKRFVYGSRQASRTRPKLSFVCLDKCSHRSDLFGSVRCFDGTDWLLPASFEQLIKSLFISIQFAFIGRTLSHSYPLTSRLCAQAYKRNHPSWVCNEDCAFPGCLGFAERHAPAGYVALATRHASGMRSPNISRHLREEEDDEYDLSGGKFLG
jgi:hypothetical protein